MKPMWSVLAAATLFASSALGATDALGVLAPGKPAGVRKAQAETSTLVWALGAGLVIGGIALVATKGGDQSVSGNTMTSSSSGTA